MKTRLILIEKDIKRAIKEYLLGTNQGKVKSICLEQGSNDVSADPREYSAFMPKLNWKSRETALSNLASSAALLTAASRHRRSLA